MFIAVVLSFLSVYLCIMSFVGSFFIYVFLSLFMSVFLSIVFLSYVRYCFRPLWLSLVSSVVLDFCIGFSCSLVR